MTRAKSVTRYADRVTGRQRIDWMTAVGRLTALEPTLDEVREHAPALAHGYNEPRNAELMGHTARMEPEEIVEHYADMFAKHARQFLLFRDDELVGDGDLRGFAGGAAELAFMIGAPAIQGKGLGTRFALMMSALGFAEAGLEVIYASVMPQNTASLRVFEKLGFVVDTGERARMYADEDTDLVLSVDRATFERANAVALADLRIGPR